MSALIQNLTVTRGDDYGATITFDQAISGFDEVSFTVRTTYATTQTDNTDAVFAATLTGGGIVAAGANSVTIEIGHAATSGWSEEQYVYDVQVETSTGKIYTTQRGKLFVSPDVTR